ncbi:MAG: 1-acyl-sn-glycerol-3-phosphate acyltransferase [Chloroflexi bacterium]|jgi:1-acyl-sn-glycerol-3-phosphate acyltransferase|nr:MAG: 1-acyl-sn-glycerol-3-phosphate acyltransferase [SAR202 cluster bacterium]MAX12187.1 1-acyl-sn-glycerol-3-phosphate acyltransferase [Chloroflexota bacterium]|tara:strand:+ start:183 stop:857 length:675 start_codon:yes stop_codon:yes gene_type:complete
MTKLFKFCEAGLDFTFKISGSLDIKGRENVPSNVSLISVSNHLSIIDPALCAAAVPKEPRFLAKKELFKFPINIFLKFYGAFPLNRGKVDLAAFQWAKSQLSTNNKSVLIFPEGTRSKDHIIKRGYNGATLLAIDTNSVLLPLGIYGTETITNYLQFLFPKKRVTVNIGKPFKIMNVPEKKNKETYDLITIEIMERISNLLPDKYKSKRGKILEKDFIYTKTLG